MSKAPGYRRPNSGERTCSKTLPLWTTSQPHQNIPVLHFSRCDGPLTLPAFSILVFMTLNPKLAGECKTKHHNSSPLFFFREERNPRKREWLFQGLSTCWWLTSNLSRIRKEYDEWIDGCMDRSLDAWMNGWCLNAAWMDGWCYGREYCLTHSVLWLWQRLWTTTETMRDISKCTDSVPPQVFYPLFCLSSFFKKLKYSWFTMLY